MEMSWRCITLCQLLSSHDSLVKTHPGGRTNVSAGEQFSVGAAFFMVIPVYVENLFCVIMSNNTFPALHQYCLIKKKSHCKPISWMPSHANSAFLYLTAAKLLPRLLLDSFGKVFAVVRPIRSCPKKRLQG